ncbi:MAG: S9 family peptidase [Bacteroidetes bacterium]|nr:S9 family peptidase [Bacteroidota bacterium]HET6244298.1 S9 family peptidase [Bacteroidia bacterium]
MRKASFLTLIILIPFSIFAQQVKKDVKLEEIWASRIFAQEGVYGINSMENGLHYTTLDHGENYQEINQYSYETGELIGRILKSTELKLQDNSKVINIEDYQFSADESKLLIATETEQIYRHSTRSEYYVYDISSKKLFPLSNGGKQQYASFSPELNNVAFVRENNLFIKNLKDGTEKQVTTDGEFNKIINGSTDWVYEEEFSFNKAFFWSTDGKKLAYYKFDETDVKEFSMTTYNSLYPSEYKYKYPKAGEKNAVVEIFVYNLNNNENRKIDIGKETDQYIPRIQWTANPDVLSIQRLNRLQNKMEILNCNLATVSEVSYKTNVIFTETSNTYIDGSDDKLFYLEDKKHFIWLSEKDGFNHIYLYDLKGKLVNQITKGKWDVTSFYGINEKNGIVYFQSAETSPMERNVYSINVDGKGKSKLSINKGWNDASFSKGFKNFINEYSSANTPEYISLHAANGKELRKLKDNEELKGTLEKFNFSKKEFFNFNTSENVQLNCWMIKPPNFNSNNKYPVFITIYNGPGSQTVKDHFDGSNYIWHQYLAQKGYIVVSVDTRGTGARGAEFKNLTYLQLGKFETIDMIETAKHLGTLDYIDSKRIGVQGWSYGGYMSSLCITKGADYFKAAIAVAPVTNWRFYDTIYTERYMRTPQENANGYDENSPINHTAKLKGKYLIIHGTADDNVHFQNTVEMTTSLIKSNKQFDSHIYPDKNHGIYGGTTRLHLFGKMSDFIFQNL